MSADGDQNTPLLLFLTTTLELRVLPKLALTSQGCVCVCGDLHPWDNDRCSQTARPSSRTDTTIQKKNKR